jgi:hypothetical protein
VVVITELMNPKRMARIFSVIEISSCQYSVAS